MVGFDRRVHTAVREHDRCGRHYEEYSMRIARHRIVSVLRDRGQQVRADWVERELPERVDLQEHVGLLATLRLDPADLADAPSP
ncbi:hypothetical protein C1I95_04955 [Micromonospora craterilacus]|uniref:Uncharacterized protein n=2 Tax=Micromonospora craterilacus TaxID=1655439 RepID=A0A2W2F057_9ACTN|nr:hypothetical protein C1I95_04955 [Micromonospora craterilacus]